MIARQAVVDVCVVGGGPAGLSAALLLGRCHRTVVLVDEGHPRNARSRRVNCFLGLRDISPQELIEVGREQLGEHPAVTIRKDRVLRVARVAEEFEVSIQESDTIRSRALILATGLIDRLPRVEGMGECYGTSIFTCPYCDGWENSGKALGIFACGSEAASMASELCLWSDKIHLFNGGSLPSDEELKRLPAGRITVHPAPVKRLDHANGKLRGVQLTDGAVIECEVLFLIPVQVQHGNFCEQAGYAVSDESPAPTRASGATPVPGLYVAGNARKGLQLAMVAAAEGLECAAAANDWLLSTFPVTGNPAASSNGAEDAKSRS